MRGQGCDLSPTAQGHFVIIRVGSEKHFGSVMESRIFIFCRAKTAFLCKQLVLYVQKGHDVLNEEEHVLPLMYGHNTTYCASANIATYVIHPP